MKKVDIKNWERRSHYEWFSSFADPSISMDVKLDVTNLLDSCKARGLSSYAVIMYAVCRALNSSRAFRLRILGNDVVEIPYANVAYTIMVNDLYFVNCRARMSLDFESYLNDVKNNQKQYTNSDYVQKQYNNVSIIDDIYCSCIPWLNFQSVRQPVPDKSNESKSIPRACWGKYFSENNRMFVTLNITANHALVDGYDFAQAFQSIQNFFNDIDDLIGR